MVEKLGNYYIYKEKARTVGPKLVLYSAFKGRRTKSGSNFVAESTSKTKLKRYLI